MGFYGAGYSEMGTRSHQQGTTVDQQGLTFFQEA